VVEVVSCMLFGLSQVGGEWVNSEAQCFLFLMKSSLRTEEVVLGDVVVQVIILLDEEWVRRSSCRSMIASKCVSGRKQRTIPNVP
jgi:hypothetical protein